MVLLDTHVLLWLTDKQDELSERARNSLAQNSGNLFVSSITGFEIAVKAARGALVLPRDPGIWVLDALRLHGIQEIPVTCEIGALAAALPRIHADPCDRIIIATARIHDLSILTRDAIIPRYPGVRTLW